jgi:hypothetical protein
MISPFLAALLSLRVRVGHKDYGLLEHERGSYKDLTAIILLYGLWRMSTAHLFTDREFSNFSSIPQERHCSK